ncbi:MAG: glycosyltransferase family 4 protein [Nocardioides sp.]
MNAVHLVVPADIRDPRRPSGGNVYDRCLSRALRDRGWVVHEWAVSGAWPRPDAAARAALGQRMRRIPDGAVVLLDGLVASSVPDLLAPHADRLRQVVLVHLPLGHAGAAEVRRAERDALAGARAVLTTSRWTRDWLVATYALASGRVHVAPPGIDGAARALGTPTGGALLCVAAVIRPKGQDVLLSALVSLDDLPWTCTFVGSLERDPAYVAELVCRARWAGLDDRVRLVGPGSRSEVDLHYARSDLLVLPSRGETYGMVAAEAVSRGLPVVASRVGGVAEAVGRAAGGARPGRLVRVDDPAALAAALRSWLTDPDLRRRWRGAAMSRAGRLPGWPATAATVADVLTEVAA